MDHASEHDTGTAGRDIDPVPGSIGVPITVWRTPPEAGERQAIIPERLAYRLVAAYTNPGEIIVDLTGTSTIASAAADGGRTHVRAAIDGDRILITDISPAGDGTRVTVWDPYSLELLDLAAWFGDDLRDLDRPAGTVADAPATVAATPSVSLLVAVWPLEDQPDLNASRLTAVVAAAVAVVRPGGCVVFVAAADRRDRGDFTALVTGARAGGLRYLQHIVAVNADSDGDRFLYYATADDLAGLGTPGHHRIHADLVVFFTVGGDHRG